MFQSYHRLAPTDFDPMATDDDPRPTVDALFADWKLMAKTARQSLNAAARSQLAYSTVLDAYRDLLTETAMLRVQNTELNERVDVGQARILQLELTARRASPPDPLRLVQRRSAYRVEATS